MHYKFSGHETFPLRYSWLPKAYKALLNNPHLFGDEEDAMLVLGVGKNMVRAIRFWVRVTGIAETGPGNQLVITTLGHSVLGSNGYDPYLEDIKTLWLIHWNISTLSDGPLFAWDYLFNHWHHPDISRSEVVKAFQREVEKMERKLSTVTLEQHLDVFLHTYVPTRSRKGEILEDSLDSPLVELNLIEPSGERETEQKARRETVYTFRWSAKPEISANLFIWCLKDYWDRHRNAEGSLQFRDVAISPGSPGQIFKLPEEDIRRRLETIDNDSNSYFHYVESAAQPRVIRSTEAHVDWLAAIYQVEESYARNNR